MAKARGSLSRTFVWIILALLIVGLAGFGATNFSGNVSRIGKVGESDIGVQDYFRALQNEIRATGAQAGSAISFPQAQAMGLPQRVLAQVVVTTALEEEARALGISIGDENLAEQLRSEQAFQGPDGFNRDAYAYALQNAGLNEREFEEQLRRESASTLLQGAVLAGTVLPDTYLDTLTGWALEERSFTWAELTELPTGLPVPTDADLQAFYDQNIADYTLPETRMISYVWLTPEMIVDSVEVDEATLRGAYDERSAIYNQPERRLVERLVFADQAEAEAALARVVSDEVTFEALVTERGLALGDVDMGDVARADLGAAADLVFGAEVGVVVGPGSTDLGPALFRVNAVLAAQTTSYEEALPALRDEFALDRARRVIEAQAQTFDDDLAAGATLEELAESSDLELGQIGWTAASDNGPAAYDTFRQRAAQVTGDDFPEVEMLGDGGLFALRLDEIRDPTPEPLEDIRDRVERDWEQNARSDALVAAADTLTSKLSGTGAFEAEGLVPAVETGLTRNAATPDIPPGLLARAFEMTEGDVVSVAGPGTAYLLRLDAITAADGDGETAELMRQVFGDGAARDVAEDLFRALATDIQNRAGVEIDQQAINAVHANFQ